MERRIVPGIVSDQDLSLLSADAKVQEAVEIMTTRKIGAVLIVSEDGSLAGIFTERDVVARVVHQGKDSATTTLGEVMTPNPESVRPEDTALTALEKMSRRGFRHLPVIADDGSIAGIVSIRDLYSSVLEELEEDVRQRNQLIFDTGYGSG